MNKRVWASTATRSQRHCGALCASGDFADYLAFHLTNEHGLTPQPRYTHEVMPNPLSFTSVELRPAM